VGLRAFDKPLPAATHMGLRRSVNLLRTEHRYVARQPCLICGRKPADSHHLRRAQPRALGRKASDEFTVPLCHIHHRLVHRVGMVYGAVWSCTVRELP
jgi:hypothetical protein